VADVARLLDADEPSPILLHPPGADVPAWAAADGAVLLAADHAGRRLPRRLGDLGISEAELRRHIGWDIGIWGVTTRLADALGALAIGQAYSRLVIDCNRHPDWPSACPAVSESTPIPGNAALSPADRAARVAEIHAPYHAALAAAVAARCAPPPGRPLLYVAMHSFTPIYKGIARPWHAGVLFDVDDHATRALAEAMLAELRAEPGLVVGANEPYVLSASSDHAVPTHAQANGVPYLELEIRQDLIAEPAGQAEWAARLARMIPAAWARFRR
jgi:predicted N-formylglutamate amidohydrolase